MSGKSYGWLVIAVIGVIGALVLQACFTGDIADLYANIFSYYVPPYYTIMLGKYVCDIWSFNLLPVAKHVIPFDDCFEGDVSDSVKVLIATPKGGVAFAGKVFSIISLNCGIRIGISNGITDDWPEIDSYPSESEYDLQYMLAYATDWETYYDLPFNKEKTKQCVVLTRKPIDRLVSLYAYAKDGTEYGLTNYSKVMHSLDTVPERLEYLWNSLGKTVLTRSQPALLKALELNCTQVFSDKLFKSSELFEIELNKIFKEYQIKPSMQGKLLKLIKKHDLTNKKEKNFHASGRTLEVNEKKQVRELILKNKEISELLDRQARELNYET